MGALFIPIDGELTSQNVFPGPLVGTEVMEIVSPGNATQGNTYQVQTSIIGAYGSALAMLNSSTIISGATFASPYGLQTTETRVLFNKAIGSASYALCPLAVTMLYSQEVFFKDLKGDAGSNSININFTSGELCDGSSSLQITSAYGFLRITPIIGGGGWYRSG